VHTTFASGFVGRSGLGRYASRLEIGVSVFFVISGFLLYRPFAAQRLIGARGTRLRDYVRRRLLRIVPAYWLALTVLAIWPGLPGVFTGQWWVYYGFGQIYSDNTVLNGIGPAWSLCVEMTFYLLLPLYAFGVRATIGRYSLRTQVRLELALLTLLGGASVAYRGWLTHHNPISPGLHWLPTFVDWFAIGMGFAVISVALQARDPALPAPAALRLMRRAPWLCWLGAAVPFWAVSKLVHGPRFVNIFGHVALTFTPTEAVAITLLYGLLCAGVLAPAVFGADGGGWLRRLLLNPVLQWLGLISYGIYLWHAPIMDHVCAFDSSPGSVGCTFHGVGVPAHTAFLILVIVVTALAIACAAISYYVVERPALAFKNGIPRRLHTRRTPVTDG
jgi:peptidoglycan/LPS O-acetylase OafA/YrhL